MPQPEPPAELVEIAAKAVTLCPICEGEGTVCDGLDDAACSTPCPPCFGTGYDTRAVLAAVTPQIEARIVGEIVAWLRERSGAYHGRMYGECCPKKRRHLSERGRATPSEPDGPDTPVNPAHHPDHGGDSSMSDTNALADLLPCPFCGNDGSAGSIEDALHVIMHEHDWRDASWSVQCDKCTATMGYSSREDEAIDAWNTRTAEQALAERDALITEAAQIIGQIELDHRYPPAPDSMDRRIERARDWVARSNNPTTKEKNND